MVTHILSVPKQVNKQGCGHPTNWLLEFEGQQGESLRLAVRRYAPIGRARENCHSSGKAAMMQGLLDVLTCRSVMLICLHGRGAVRLSEMRPLACSVELSDCQTVRPRGDDDER